MFNYNIFKQLIIRDGIDIGILYNLILVYLNLREIFYLINFPYLIL